MDLTVFKTPAFPDFSIPNSYFFGGSRSPGGFARIVLNTPSETNGPPISLTTSISTYAAPSATPAKPKATCSDRTYNKAVSNAAPFAVGLSPNFCSDWSLSPGAPMSKVYTSQDLATYTKRTSALGRRTPPPQRLKTDSYPGWSIKFTWTPNHTAGACVQRGYCNNAISSLLYTCQGLVSLSSTSNKYQISLTWLKIYTCRPVQGRQHRG
jgi:hypothetical protein